MNRKVVDNEDLSIVKSSVYNFSSPSKKDKNGAMQSSPDRSKNMSPGIMRSMSPGPFNGTDQKQQNLLSPNIVEKKKSSISFLNQSFRSNSNAVEKNGQILKRVSTKEQAPSSGNNHHSSKMTEKSADGRRAESSRMSVKGGGNNLYTARSTKSENYDDMTIDELDVIIGKTEQEI